MGTSDPFPTADALAWIAGQESLEPAAARARQGEWKTRFDGLLSALSENVCDRWPPGDGELAIYGRRVWSCFEHHWRRMAADRTLTFDEVHERFARGDLGISVGQGNLLEEVMLAQALELRQAKAAVVFETEYMPDVRRIARRTGGERAAESVENLAADLILPRELKRGAALAPRIASYQGRTSLRSWLRAVIVHGWISATRKAPHLAIVAADAVADRRAPAASHDGCEELLRPIFAEAVTAVDAEGRLLIKMLILDNVQQQSLARSLGVHTGNVTRRRQRALEQILAQAHNAGRRGKAAARFDDCLELLLAGDDRELRQSLAGVLAGALENAGRRAGEGAEP